MRPTGHQLDSPVLLRIENNICVPIETSALSRF